MPAKRIKSLHFNLEPENPFTKGKNIIFHREHRSKKGRNNWHCDDSPRYLKKRKQMEEDKYQIDLDCVAL